MISANKTITIDAPTATSSKSGGVSVGEQNLAKNLATQRSVQRNLFGDDDDKKPVPSEKAKPSSATSQRKVPPGMSPAEDERIADACNKIGQLKERLAGYNNAAQKLKEFKLRTKRSVCWIRSKPKPTLEFEIT